MPKNIMQFNGDDGCIYIFDLDSGYWFKVCSVDKLPSDVRKKIYEYLNNAEDIAINAEVLKKSI